MKTTMLNDHEKYSQLYFERRIEVLREAIAKSIPSKDLIDPNGIFSSTIQSYQLSKESLQASSQVLQRLEKDQEDKHGVDPSLLEAAKEAVEKTTTAVDNLSKTSTIIGSNAITSCGLVHLLTTNKEIQRDLFECAVLVQSTPKKLAEWCAKDPQQNHLLLDDFLANPECMKSFIVAGGPVHGNFGPALVILENLHRQVKEKFGNCSITSLHHQTLLELLALAVALEHASPIPIWKNENSEYVDPTERFWHYADAHLDGALDPAFDTLSVWEMRMVVDADATHQDLTWGRDYLKAYRPDEIWTPDEHWRYVMAVKSDVGYRQPEHEYTNYKDLVSAGGKCGARAWFGRFICKAWGIPTWGIRQPGHAALTRWTSDGWKICLGAPNWGISWWDEMRYIGDNNKATATRRGSDFLEEYMARTAAKMNCGQPYEDVILLECLAECFGETIENDFVPQKFWRSLSLAKRKLMATSPTKMSSKSVPCNALSAKIMVQQSEHGIIMTELDGNIVIPAASFMKKPMGVSSMDSFLGGKQVHFLKNKDVMVEYELPATIVKGTYALSLKVVNIHRNQVPMEIGVDHSSCSCVHEVDDFEIVAVVTEPQELIIPYTEGEWQTTKEPIHVDLSPRSRLQLSRKAPCWGLTMKDIVLTPINLM